MSAQNSSDSLPQIVYVYDALCGWCYGFAPVMHKIEERYQYQLDFRVVSGGMVMGEREGPIGEVAPYIKSAYKTVEDHCDVKFGEAFLKNLDEGSMVFSSWLPSVALTVFRDQKPEEALAFAEVLQRAIYFEGMPPTDANAYALYANHFGLDGVEFVQHLHDSTYHEQTRQDFQLASQLGVNGFPTVFLLKDERLYLLTRGYTDFETLNEAIGRVLRGEVKVD